jgi:hypothetical protein
MYVRFGRVPSKENKTFETNTANFIMILVVSDLILPNLLAWGPRCLLLLENYLNSFPDSGAVFPQAKASGE